MKVSRVVMYSLKKDKNYENYLRKIEIAENKINEMKESGVINVRKIFELGMAVGVASNNLNWR